MNLLEQPVWSEVERRAWRPPERIAPSAWAEKYRGLTRNQSKRFGPWRNANAPYGIGIMDLCAIESVEEVNIQKAAQIGVSEFIRCVIGWVAHTDPDPLLFVMPDEKSGRKIIGKRLLPLFKSTSILRELLTTSSRDLSLAAIRLANGFEMSLGWSGSASTLASDPIRRVVNDEVDKFQAWSGAEADPISLGRVRTQTYESDRLLINLSTPTTRDGFIHQLVEESDVILHYFVPCPHCGGYQRLVFDRLRWLPREALGLKSTADPQRWSAALLAEQKPTEAPRVWYECVHCEKKIRTRHKPDMVGRGVWAPEDWTEDDGGLPEHGGSVIDGLFPGPKIVGMRINCLPCLWVSFEKTASEFIRCGRDPRLLMNFYNSWLGEVFELQIERPKASVFARKSDPEVTSGLVDPGVLPRWTGVLLASADTQIDGFYWVVRAWGHGFRSARIAHGHCRTREELRGATLERSFHFEGDRYPPMAPARLAIDSGGGTQTLGGVSGGGASGGGVSGGGERIALTERVYHFAMSDPLRILPVKGESEPIRGMPIRMLQAHYDRQMPTGGSKKRPIPEIRLHGVDTNHFKDLLSGRSTEQIEALDLDTGELIIADSWALNTENDPIYNRQMASEQKIMVRRGRKQPIERWVPVREGAENHYLDCEVYNYALAYIVRVDLLAPIEVIDRQRQLLLGATQRAEAARADEDTFTDYGGRPWLITDR